MMDYTYLMEERGMEGSILEESFLWEPEAVLFNHIVDVSTIDHVDLAPINSGGSSNKSGTKHGKFTFIILLSNIKHCNCFW